MRFFFMKYQRLTKEQFEALHQEFATFLASHSIDKTQWDALKKEQDNKVEVLLDEFSDLVWEDVLSKNIYIEHQSPHHLFLFEGLEEHMNLIAIKADVRDKNIHTAEGWEWLLKHLKDAEVTVYRSSKPYDKERSLELFGIIEKGGQLSAGERFKTISSFLS